MKGWFLVWALCPLAALFWFCTSLDARIESGWEYVNRPKQLEFVLFKTGIAALLIAPAVGLACSRRRSILPLTGTLPGLLVTKEAVAAWMIVLVGWGQKAVDTERMPLSYQLMLCAVLTSLGLAFAYAPFLIEFAIRRRRLIELER